MNYRVQETFNSGSSFAGILFDGEDEVGIVRGIVRHAHGPDYSVEFKVPEYGRKFSDWVNASGKTVNENIKAILVQ